MRTLFIPFGHDQDRWSTGMSALGVAICMRFLKTGVTCLAFPGCTFWMCTGRAQERDLGMRVRKPIGKDYKSIDTDQQFLGAKQNLHSMSQDPLIVLYSLVFLKWTTTARTTDGSNLGSGLGLRRRTRPDSGYDRLARRACWSTWMWTPNQLKKYPHRGRPRCQQPALSWAILTLTGIKEKDNRTLAASDFSKGHIGRSPSSPEEEPQRSAHRNGG